MSQYPFSAVLLAAGSSSRMQGRCKQLLPIPAAQGDIPAVRATAQALLASGAQEVVVVTGFRSREVVAVLGDLPVTIQANPRYEDGQMTSVTAGLSALHRPCSAIMVCLADVVLVEAEDYRLLAEEFAVLPADAILVPHQGETRGNPVVFASSRVPEILAGTLNPGCRRLIAEHPDQVVRREFEHDRFVRDMDTPEDYDRICARLRQRHQSE